MRTWTSLPGEEKVSYSPVGLRLLDELTNSPPLGNVDNFLDIQDAAGNWRPTTIQGSVNTDAVLAYPDLERHAIVTGLQPRKYRVRLSADYYIPYYRLNSEGITFTAYPFNDTNPPAQIARVPVDAPLLPGTNYPFGANIPVLRGVVVDAAGNPVADVSVTQGNTERAITDAQGDFALPLRWISPNSTVPIDASDQRTGRTGSINIQFPAALGNIQQISIS